MVPCPYPLLVQAIARRVSCGAGVFYGWYDSSYHGVWPVSMMLVLFGVLTTLTLLTIRAPLPAQSPAIVAGLSR